MAAITICSDFGAQKNEVWHCFHCFLINLPWSEGTDAMILVFWMLSFKPTFSLSSFTFIKRLFSSSQYSFKLLLFFPSFSTSFTCLWFETSLSLQKCPEKVIICLHQTHCPTGPLYPLLFEDREEENVDICVRSLWHAWHGTLLFKTRVLVS